MTTRTIPAGEFKARCLALMDEVAATGDEIVITKRGKPVARLAAERPPEIPNLAGSILYQDEDIWKPLGIRWVSRAEKDDEPRP